MEVSAAAMQKRLKEAFTEVRHLTSEEVARQCCYYDRKAGAVALQPGDVVMVHTDGFVGKRKVKDHWEDGGFIVESQLEDWPIYKVKCPTSDDRQKPKYANGSLCKLLFAGFLVSSYPKRALIWENCRERLHIEIFVRVLRSSEVISLILCK